MDLSKIRITSSIACMVILLGNQMCSIENENGGVFKRDIDFNNNWKFKRCDAPEDTIEIYKTVDYNAETWERVTLPHAPRLEPLVVNDQWQGVCWYRKNFSIAQRYEGQKIYIEFEGAMQIADVWINGSYKTTHYGGYLPFTVDVTDNIFYDKENVIAVRLDNRDNPEVPPGKPLEELDFCLYGGLYRNVKLHITDRLHITDAVHADRVAGGGVFVRYPVVNNKQAQIWVQTHVINENDTEKKCKLVTKLYDDQNDLVAEKIEERVHLESLEDRHITQTVDVRDPELWHPYAPYLYKLHSIILHDNKVVDRVVTPIGIRDISFDTADGFRINGEKFYLRGTNRHQEYPYVGYALSDNAHYRDALIIKQAGFDFVRLSHYPHAEAFMDACDKLGILVMDAIPGWQFFGNEVFQQRSYQDCRDMIRRDRNHPSVILWEVSLNESDMTREFMENAHRIAHAEYPGEQCYTAGWLDHVYDIFIPARQHARAPQYWKDYHNSKPMLIAEYGDWEYYAQDAGCNQSEYKKLTPEERNSRQLRGDGEKRLLQQALNYQEAFNDNLASPAVGCANWLIFDYNRGYAPDIEASGIMDIFRIPKFAYYFYKSQRPPDIATGLPLGASPLIYIADYWTEDSDPYIKVFSNCEKVTLFVNGRAVATRNPDDGRYSDNLRYPPFTFRIDKFDPGEIKAIGFIDGKQVASHTIMTPSTPKKIRLTAACNGVRPEAGEKDVFFVYAAIIDENKRVVPTASDSVTFNIKGPGRLIGQNPIAAEAGVASILVETTGAKGRVEIGAEGPALLTPEKAIIRVD